MWSILPSHEYLVSILFYVVLYLLYKGIKKIVIALKGWLKKKDYPDNFEKPAKIRVISDFYACKKACAELKAHCHDLSALGFDCEWVNEFGALGAKIKPVALLQLASCKGLCCLFRLNVLKEIPPELQEILGDPHIIKLGVNALNDARLLENDYSVQIHTTLDLRYLYPTILGGLAGLSQTLLGITLNKDLYLTCSNWEAFELTPSQEYYAAMDVLAAIEIFKKWLKENQIIPTVLPNIYLGVRRLSGFYNRHFKRTIKNQELQSSSYKPESALLSKNNTLLYGHQIRKKPLYHNCFMHAPDGELLCSCDRRKAEWYIERGLAKVFLNEPFSIKLLFEPAARANTNNEGRFYQQLKRNCCVVCGASDSYLRYNVVPREYRKHFPKIMKEHQSHDIVLLCTICHQLASYHAKVLKKNLAELCNAPFHSGKVEGSETYKRVKNYGRALLKSGENIPFSKKCIMENEIKNFFGVTELTINILQNAASLKMKCESESSAHGLKVTEYFSAVSDGLMELEILWRKHFLSTMQPKYLPALWSITHNHSRLMTQKLA